MKIVVIFLSLIFFSSHAAAVNQSPPAVIVIFGSSGDLTSRKLMPAIYNLSKEGYLSEHTAVIGFARREGSNELFRTQMKEAIDANSRLKPIDSYVWKSLEERLFYNQSNFDVEEGYDKLAGLLKEIDKKFGTQGNRLYFLATPPNYFPTIVEKLSSHGLISKPNSTSWSRVVIEKPFGYDTESAIELQNTLSRYLDDSQIYRMDHYLGKVGVQNLYSLRFENSLFEPVWNRKFIDNVQITISEDIGIGTRANLWEGTGLLRDIFQNHMMQLLSIVAMEPPKCFNSDVIHLEKTKVLNAIKPIPMNDIDSYIERGQYGPGEVKGEKVLGYRQEKGVAENSQAETYVAAKLWIDNERWRGVPFYLRSGKRLPKQTTEITINFKKKECQKGGDVLTINIQPKTGISLTTLATKPGINTVQEPIVFGYNLNEYFKAASPDAYEKLIYDAINGDQSLFVSQGEQLAAWKLFTPVLNYWKTNPTEKFPNYEAGTWGPQNGAPIFDVFQEQCVQY